MDSTGRVGLSITLALLMCLLGNEALELLRVSTASGNPASTPTVRCWCSSYPNRTLCSWPAVPHHPPSQYIATYSERHTRAVAKQCHLIPPSSSSSALTPTSSSSSSSEQLWQCHLPDLKLLTDYIFNVTAVYPTGSSSHLTSFMLEDIVKPDPPVNVQVSPHGYRTLLVEWSPPPTWSNLDIFPLKYHIQYQWHRRGSPQTVHLGPFENTSVQLKGLTPARTYVFQVCAEDMLGLGECSLWSSPVKTTMPQRTT